MFAYEKKNFVFMNKAIDKVMFSNNNKLCCFKLGTNMSKMTLLHRTVEKLVSNSIHNKQY